MDGRELRSIYRRLETRYGPQHWWPARTRLEVVVGAVLTQNTAWSNVEKALAVLRRRHCLFAGRLLALTPSELAPLIRSAGCGKVKSRRLVALLTWLDRQGGIRRLGRVPTQELRAGLLSVGGVGPETADSILLYAFGRPVFVVDSYTRRILSRYGLIRGTEAYDAVRLGFESALGPDARLFNEYHALLVRHARVHCRTRPACDRCPLARGIPASH